MALSEATCLATDETRGQFHQNCLDSTGVLAADVVSAADCADASGTWSDAGNVDIEASNDRLYREARA